MIMEVHRVCGFLHRTNRLNKNVRHLLATDEFAYVVQQRMGWDCALAH